MIINTFLSLLFLGFFSQLVNRERYSQLLSLLVLAGMSMVFFNFYQNWRLLLGQNFVYPWLNYPSLQVNVNLSASASDYSLLFPGFFISLLMLLINVFYPQENFKSKFAGALLLNVAFFMLLICSRNLVQLLISSAMVGVIGFYIIDDTKAREKYVFYNLLADMGLLTVFAVIYGQLGNVELSELGRLEKNCDHQDLIALLLLISVFIKSGLFLFHNQFIDLSKITFNRLLVINYISTPLAGVIILGKLMPLLTISSFALPAMQIIAVLTMLWGFVNMLVIDNIKEKSVYWAMMLYGYIYSLISLGNFNQDKELPGLILLGSAFSLNIFMIYVSSSNGLYASEMGGFIKRLKVTFVISLLSGAAFIHMIMRTLNAHDYAWGMGYLIFGIIAWAHFISSVFLGGNKADERVVALLKNAPWYLILPTIFIVGWLLSVPPIFDLKFYYLLSGFIVLIIVYPFSKLEALANYEPIQKEDYFAHIYDWVLLTPLRIIGRILWLLVDFILIERTIISSLNHVTSLLVKTTSYLHRSSVRGYLFLSLLGLAILLTAHYVRG